MRLGSAAARGCDICPCTGKVRYETERAAEAMLSELRHKRAPGQKRNRRVYLCGGCGGWHLTSWKRKKR